MKKRIPLLIIILSLSFNVFASDWHSWRGPNKNGITTEKISFDIVNQNKVLWTFEAGSGWSMVAVANGVTYTMGNINDQDIIYALEEKSGQVLWKYAYDCPAGNFPGPRCTPVYDEGRIYSLSRDGQIYCLDADHGKVIWKQNVNKDFGAELPRWGFAGSALIEGDMAIFNACSYGIAFHKATGQLIWKSPAGIGNYSTPVLYELNGTKNLAIFGETTINGVNLKTGKRLWSYEWITDYHINAADPLYFDGKLFITTGYGRGSALLDVSTNQPKVLWENIHLNAQFSSPILLNGYIYGSHGQVGNRKGTVVCLDPQSGNVVWSQKMGFNAFMATQSELIVLNEQGKFSVIDAKGKGSKELYSADVIESSRKNPCWSPPVFVNGRAYFRNGGGKIVVVQVGAIK